MFIASKYTHAKINQNLNTTFIETRLPGIIIDLVDDESQTRICSLVIIALRIQLFLIGC